MNPTAFIELLNQDDPSEFKDLKQLDRLLKNHPYFQIGLAAKSRFLKSKQHIDFIKISRRTAIIFPNRSKFHHYINKTKKRNLDHPVEADSVKKENTIISEPPVKQPIEREIIVVESKTTQEDKSNTTIIDSQASELEKNYLAEAINQSIQLESAGYAIKDDKPVDDTSEEVTNKILSFSDWLSGKTKIASRQIQNKLIENFINEEPVISKVQKKEFYSPIEKGKESISDSNLPISETLAQIFADQGNKLMAIKGYEKLRLKYPEKSIYFAGLIKKLKEK
jgi:hypothetical protein